jgi:outer membrane biosynthesis protein TonB
MFFDYSSPEDKEIERLINKKPAPSRKHRPKRGPKHDNRRRRMKDTSDPDTKALKRDMQAAENIATSNENFLTRDMSLKTSTYHGVIGQGHPSGPTNTGYNSYDNRYFNSKNFESIVACAKELMSSDWFKSGWEGGFEDAPMRAALDTAIYMADNNLYQSKIDSNTYNLLLTKLAGKDIDLFSNTLVDLGKVKRSSMAMDKDIQNMVRIANEIRTTNPKLAFEIIRNVRSIAAQKTAKDSGFNLKDVKHKLDSLKKARTPEQLMEVLEGLAETVKISSARTANVMQDLAPIADMSDEEIDKLVNMAKREVMKLEHVIADMEKKAAEDATSITEDDIDSFVKGMDDFFNAVVKDAEKAKTASVSISISSLLRVASSSPEAKAAVMPFLLIAKKKMEKAKKHKKNSTPKKEVEEKEEKKSEKKVTEKKKQEPAFLKTMKGKKKKASVEILSDDTSW